MNRREFLHLLFAASAAGLTLPLDPARAEKAAEALYDPPAFGNVSLLHITDCHAQLRPIYFREPNVNIGVGAMANRPPHLVGEAFLKHFGVQAGTRLAHAFTFLDYERYAALYGRVGGFAHLATLVKRLRATRPGALLLDGGDTWQGSGAAMWTKGQDMVDAAKLLGVDAMTLHWECTYGQDRVKEIADKDFAGHVDIVAQNIKTQDFGDPVFNPYVMRRSTASRSRLSVRLSPTRRSPIPAIWSPTGPSASRKKTCRKPSTPRAPTALKWWWSCPTTAWTLT